MKRDPEKLVGFQVADVARLLRKVFNKRAQSLGLSYATAHALGRVAKTPGLKQAALAELLEIQPISLARMIDRLEEEGLVERRRDPGDRRAFLLYPTEKTALVVEELWVFVEEMRGRVFDGVSAEEEEVTLRTLARLKANLALLDEEEVEA